MRRAPTLLMALLVPLLVAACGRPESKADALKDLLAAGENARINNQFDVAEKNLRAALRQSPSQPEAIRGLALLYSEQGQWPVAIPFLKQAAELKPDDAEIQTKLGLAHLLTREYKAAREVATKVLELSPKQEDAAILLADSGDTSNAISDIRGILDELTKKNGDQAGYHVARGVLEARQGNDPAAEQQFQEALRLDPKSSGALTAMATLNWKRKDLTAAETAYRAAAELEPPRYAATIRYADFLIATNNLDRARDVLQKLNERSPSYLPPRVILMKLACSAKQDEACISRVQNVLSQDPINFDALLISGNISLEKNDPTAAIRSFDQALKLSGQSPQLLYSLARAYLMVARTVDAVNARKYVDSAEGLLTSALQLAPTFDQAALLLADLKIRKGSGASAVDLLTPLIARQPGPEAYNLLAAAYLSQQNTDSALEVYQRMAGLFPRNPLPHQAMGAIYVAKGQAAEARQSFEKSLLVSPDFGPATEALVNLDVQSRNFDAALARVKQQLDKHPAEAQWWGLSGKVKLDKGDYDGAEQDLGKALEIDPDLELAQLLLGRTYIAAKKPEMAIKKLTEITTRKKSVAPLILLATLQEQQKNIQAARETYESALAVAPNNAMALNNLAVIYSNQGDIEKASDLAKKAQDAAPSDSRVGDTLGWILYKKHQYREALSLLRDSASKNQNDPDIQFHYGMAAYATGDESGAAAAFAKVAQSAVNTPFRSESQRRIDFLSLESGGATPDEARIKAFLKDYPDDPVALKRLSELASKRADTDGAIQGYEKLLAMYPEFAPATRELTLLYAGKTGNNPKALEVALKARQSYPSDPEIGRAVGILQFKAENFPRAIELLKEVVSKRPEDATAYYFLGKSYHELKDRPQCKSALERSIALNVGAQFAESAKSGLADCTDPSQ